MALLGLWLRRLAYERTAALALVALLFVTALAVALAPRVLEQQATSALTRELAAASSIERALVIHETAGTRARPATDFAGLTSAAADLAAGFPGEVAALVRDRRVVVDTAYWQVHAGPAISALIRLRVHDGAFEQLEFITGRPPTEAVETVADERPTAAAGQRATVYEAAMPASAAAMLDVGVGDVLPLETWRGDPTNLAINLGALVRIVGTYEAVDRDADFWINDTTALGWRWFSVGTNDYLDTSALLHPAAYDALVAATHDAGMTLHFQYRYLTDTDRLAAEGVPATIGSLRRLAGAVPRTGISDVASDTRLNSGLLRLLERHQLSWQSVMALLSLIGLGVLTIAAATLAAVTLVASAGRVRVARLLRARGAAGRQVLGSTAAEMALLATPAALAGLAIALALLPGPAPAPAVALAAFVAFLAVVVAVGVVSRAAAGGPAGRLLRGRRPGARRLMLESSLVAGALGGAWLLRERGISALAAGGGAELIVAAVLALVGLAAGIICVRIYPLPVRLLGGLVALRRDLLPVLAVRRATRGGSSAALLFLLVATATVGAFASAALVHLDRSAELGAWHAVGADQRISAAAGMAILPAGQ